MPDSLFAHDRCERCGAIAAARTASFFTEDTICMACLGRESRLMGELRASGVNVALLANCGYVPTARKSSGLHPLPPAPAEAPGADDRHRPRITTADVQAALRRLRARSQLLRIPPGALSSGHNLPPLA